MRQLAFSNEHVCTAQESTIGAAFLTKTIPEKGVKFEIWWAPATSLVMC